MCERLEMCNDCALPHGLRAKPVRHTVRPTRVRNQIIGIVGIGLAREEVAHNGSTSLENYNILEFVPFVATPRAMPK
jgi:hypothetical protein